MFIFAAAASELKPGQKTTVSNSDGDSYTVHKRRDGSINVWGNNRQSKLNLEQYIKAIEEISDDEF